MTTPLTLVECPRDAWQGLAHIIPTANKVAYLQSLLDAGFRRLDAVSFVSPAAVPQMADSESVLTALDLPADAAILAIVVNQRGAERALATGKVAVLGYPHSISAEFLARNQHQTQETSLALLTQITALATANRLQTVAYLSMAFGNPYGEAWSLALVLDACRRIADCGVRQLSLADTVGAATPQQVAGTFAAVRAALPALEIGLHLHARREAAPALLRAAFDAGCCRFDSALGGLGGCPFAQDSLVGNIPTEILLETFADPAHTALSASPLAALAASRLSALVRASHAIAVGDSPAATIPTPEHP